MNNGLYGFPASNYGTSVIEVKEFDTSGSYVIPNGAKRLSIMLIGGGGGGGGGRRNIIGSGNAAYGGGGGAGGTINLGYFFVESIGGSAEATAAANAGQTPATSGRILNIVIGAGGGGGAGSTADSTNGSAGSPGGASTIAPTGMPGFMMYSSGGNSGGGGSNSTGSAGSGQSVMFNGAPYPTTYQTSGTNGIISLTGNTPVQQFTTTGGQGGGGVNNVTAIGGLGFIGPNSTILSAITNPNYARNATVKAGGATNTATSQESEQLTVAGPYTPGLGGVGGGGASATSANNGTNGWRGGGGGGGGGANNGITTGNGGSGGNGYCVIIAYG
jgi:hypothetical protein